jgi:hypothetical protein
MMACVKCRTSQARAREQERAHDTPEHASNGGERHPPA